jgi:hypothetical protein
MVNERRIANGSLAEGSVQWCRAIDTPIIACKPHSIRRCKRSLSAHFAGTFVIYLFWIAPNMKLLDASAA